MSGHTTIEVGVEDAVPAADPGAGVLVAGRYRLAELVGRGGTARVWRARDELLDRDVAVKQLDRSHSHGLAEARLAARVRHPQVGVVHDVVVHEGSDWLVMDYHGGASLAAVLSGGRRRLPPPVVAALGLQLLAALRAVHAGRSRALRRQARERDARRGRATGARRFRHRRDRRWRPRPSRPPHRSRRRVARRSWPPNSSAARRRSPRPTCGRSGRPCTRPSKAAHPSRRPRPCRPSPRCCANPPQPARRAGRLQPLLALLLDKDPARRPSHDTVQAMLTDAYPTSRPIPASMVCGSAAGRRAARSAAASRPAGGATSTLPGPRIPVGAAA